jgi:dihydroorotase
MSEILAHAQYGRLTDPPASFLLTGVRLVDPSDGRDAVADLAVVGGQIVDGASAPGDLPSDVPRVDGRGLVAAPGLCDLHTHLREPGRAPGETVASGARAAAHGGYTTVCAMPNTDPPLDEAARVAYVSTLARDAAVRVRVIGAITRGRAGQELTDAAEMAAQGAVGFSDDGAALPTARLVRSALLALAPLGLPLIEHAEDASLADGTLMRSGSMATRLGLAGWPPAAELIIVERDIALAEETGGWLHLTHLSTAAALVAVRRAKDRGVHVTCDVTPHHLALTDAWVGGDRAFSWQEAEPASVGADPFGASLDASLAYDGSCRVNPPLPARADALALLAGAADGTVDAIATDHAPHPPERTAVEFAAASPGMIGLETALSIGLAAVEAGCLTLSQILAALSSRPAGLIGEGRSLAAGSTAELVVFDPGARWSVSRQTLASQSTNTPLLGMTLPGVVRLTVANGRITFNHGLLGEPSTAPHRM